MRNVVDVPPGNGGQNAMVLNTLLDPTRKDRVESPPYVKEGDDAVLFKNMALNVVEKGRRSSLSGRIGPEAMLLGMEGGVEELSLIHI